MGSPETLAFAHDAARRRYADLVAAARRAVVCLDFDGTLAPIVDDPKDARLHPDAPAALVRLSEQVAALVVVTGRPVRQAVALGDLDVIGADVAERGGEFLVLGQYGNERWSARDRRVISPRPPRGLASLISELPDLLRRNGLEKAHIESKGLAVAVHTRRLDDPQGAQETLTPLLERAAARHGLVTEPGRFVVEVRAEGMDKGSAVRRLQREFRADALVFVGDDLGDVEAFKAVAALRRGGMVGFLVCSGSDEQQALVDHADLVVDGPDGVVSFLERLHEDAANGR